MTEEQLDNSGKSPSEIQKIAKSYSSGWRYAEHAFQYGMSIVVCTLIGYGIDSWFGTGNIFMIGGVLFGSVFGFLALLKSLGVWKIGSVKKDKLSS